MIICDPNEAAPGGQTVTSLRRRIALGILAEHEHERLGLTVTRDELNSMMRWYREQYGLHRRDDLEGFMRAAGLSRADLTTQMRTFCQLTRVQAHHGARLESLLPDYLAFSKIEGWSRSRRDGGT
ncbi:MAG: hypothetical protein K0V04_04930 [Deltaproteobacteria bacterium]|nr:hypothetical protein [Deltaproteobacteria bacterium]